MNQCEQVYDIAIVGGGINGAGIAADAAGRGLKVLLCERKDFASGTSSTSSKLIHGGLRYLEHYEFRLVREALGEREVLLKKAGHLVSPLKFTLPHRPHLRPAWLIRAGLFLYDHLSFANTLPTTKRVRFGAEHPLQAHINLGFEYYDCWVDDSRLVISNVLDAARHGATIKARTSCEQLEFDSKVNLWNLSLKDVQSQQHEIVKAKTVVNACGPWLSDFTKQTKVDLHSRRGVRLIKGSHIVVPRTLTTEGAYILQNEDKRIVFVLPYEEKFTIIGTTDQEYRGDPAKVAIDDWEVDYLLSIYNQHFKQALDREDIVSTYSGVRPLCDDESDDPSAITRDYTLELHEQTPDCALLSIYGGKITTYRKLAEAALRQLKPYLGDFKTSWTDRAALPGSEYFGQSRQEIRSKIAELAPWLDNQSVDRFARSYGCLCFEFLKNKNNLVDMGADFGTGLRQAEVDYLIEREWAGTAEDILWRRSKLGLLLNQSEIEALEQYVANKLSGGPKAKLRLVK